MMEAVSGCLIDGRFAITKLPEFGKGKLCIRIDLLNFCNIRRGHCRRHKLVGIKNCSPTPIWWTLILANRLDFSPAEESVRIVIQNRMRLGALG